MSLPRSRRAAAAAVALLTSVALAPLVSTPASAAPHPSRPSSSAPDVVAHRGSASAFLFYILPTTQPAPCTGVGQNASADPSINLRSCAFTSFTVTGANGALSAALYAEGATTPFLTPTVAAGNTAGTYQVSLRPSTTAGSDWTPGAGKVHLVVSDTAGEIGSSDFFFNHLVATVDGGAATAAGAAFPVTGTINEHVGGAGGGDTAVPATFKVQVTGADATTPIYTSATQTAASDGTFSVMVPASVTAGIASSQSLAVSIIDAAYTDTTAVPPPATGKWAAKVAGTASHAVTVAASALTVSDSFVSSVGWVKPGDTYPSTITVSNPTAAAATPTVAITAPTGSTLLTATGPGTHTVAASGFTWAPGSIAAGGKATLVLTSRAATTTQLPTIVWRDLSTTATMTVAGQAATTSTAHGPKVIPPADTFDTARYGDRPFPIIPVQYNDRTYQSTHSGEGLAQKINDPSVVGSTFNLYQEMSLGQLYPNGTVPSAGKATADFTYAPGFDYSQTVPGGTCAGGQTYGDLPVDVSGTALYPERITDGVYDLPGNTAYYGSDANGSALVGAQTGVGALQNIDAGCGPTGKLVHDAAALADPDIDYSDYDTDKDGVVDFFMVVYAGCGGNGASQLGACSSASSDTAPYDNIWPHSSSLAGAYTDPVTGLPGFATDDQLKDLQDRPLWWTDTTYTTKTTTDMGAALKVFVRIGPYNVNPETAIDHASVISHEYGHSLGLPDFYTTGSRTTYGDWNLMATDKSQNMDAFSRQELGWVVPQPLPTGTTTVHGMTNSKVDTGAITWQTPSGTPYTLHSTGSGGTDGIVHNSTMYVAKLPGRTLLDGSAFDTGDTATKSHLWWSGSGNDFGCAPTGGHNFDLAIPELKSLPAGTTVKLQLKSRWDIEWDFDYGFVLTSTNGGSTYTSHASENGYTTSKTALPSGNPNMAACQDTYSNGLTGSSGSYKAGTQAADRLTGTYGDPVFVSDSYDISDLAGAANGSLRFSYATDPGAALPGWFIDDLKVVATVGGVDKTIYSTDFETSGDPADTHVYNGGCREDLMIASSCTKGWKFLQAGAASVQDHAYYMELRDRSGFDFDSHGENDRDAIGWDPGLYLAYTDEAHGYGNVGTDDPPAQSPLDSTPTAGSDTPNLNDAAFTAATARSTFSDAKASPHIDNYLDPTSASGNWEFGYDCLGFKVNSLDGTDIQTVNNLTGDVTFTSGSGCAPFDYGYVAETPTANTAPTAHAAATPNPATTGQTVTFSGATSTDAEDPTGLDYSWDLDGDGTKDASGVSVTRAFTTAGTYHAKLTVTDPQGLMSSDTVDVVVTGTTTPNTAPTAHAAASPSSAAIGQAVALSSAGTTDAETPDSLTYSWDFGNGGTTADATTKNAEVTYTAAGTYTVTLTVTDPQGLSSTATTTVTVSSDPTPNTAPTAVATATPSSATVGQTVALSGNGSSDAETAAADLTYGWDFGDGGSTADATGRDVTTSYPLPGTYTVTLTVTDAGGLTDTATTTVTVTAAPTGDTTKPTIKVSVPKIVLNTQRVTLSSSGTADDTTAAGDLTYSWDFGNGGTAVDSTSPIAHARYSRAGQYHVRLTVTDEAGNTASAVRPVNVLRYQTCNATNVTRTGVWKVKHAQAAFRGAYCDTTGTRKGRSEVVYRFAGAHFEIITGRASDGGQARVLVDGRKVATLSFRGSTKKVDFGHLTRLKGLTGGNHTVRVVMDTTTAKHGGYLEGFIVHREIG